MADYWRATGTRPSATVKFIPWDGEESGTLGSLDYAENNIVPGEEEKVRGYFNTDPCAGGYPAYRNGNPAQRIALGIQIARPEEIPGEFDVGRVESFNERAPSIVEEVFTKIDDTVPTTSGEREVFISQAEGGAEADNRPGGPVTIGDSRPVLFSSDWANFLAKGVPFFNPGPEVTGPSDENEPNNPDGLAILHTPNDNMLTLNRMTSPEPTGERFSAGWMKGMEMCANLLAWGMLRPDQGGGQTTNTDVVAYYEALPNEAEPKVPVTFDATGSYRYATAGSRVKVPESQLAYSWDFGDGTTGSGRTVSHAYEKGGVYPSVLTVRDSVSGQTDTMRVPITVVGANLPGPVLAKPAEEDPDGTFGLAWEFDEAAREGFVSYRVQEAPDASTPLNDPAEDLAAGWTASEPTEPTIQPWQHSDDADGSVRGNVKHEGERSFYTGIDREDQQPGVGPNSGVSILELKQPVALARDSELSYRSSYANDRNDISRVEAAVVDGGEPQWRRIDSVTTTNFFNVPTDEALYPDGMELRRVDLGRFAGKQIRIRFVYALGASQFVNVFRTGWYVDSIRIDTGTFETIGEPAAKSFGVTGRPRGTYGYRVFGIYAGGLATQASNLELIRVTAPPAAGGGGAGGAGGGSGSGEGSGAPVACRSRAGLVSASVRGAGRGGGVRFGFTRRVDRPVLVDVFQKSRGRRIVRDALVRRFSGRTGAFGWNGRGRGGRELSDGVYVVRFRIAVPGGGTDVVRVALRRSKGRFARLGAHNRRDSCGVLGKFKLSRPVFGATQGRALGIAYQLNRGGRVRVVVTDRRGRVVRRFAAEQVAAGRTRRLSLGARGLGRGAYRIELSVRSGAQTTSATLTAHRL
jgi:PKD repeat protein